VSDEGVSRAKAFAQALVSHNITVVSGLAEGVDTVAHETAIASGGRTIAVLGTPLDKTYPTKNKALLETIKRDHLAISQFPEGYPYQKQNFPRRNRTMALISDATVIVEAGESSGTRHQGWEALRLGRLVFIMQNVAENPDLTWPAEMISYGAQVLTRQDLPEILNDIPNFTAGGELAF
jgi:DNA processing protein